MSVSLAAVEGSVETDLDRTRVEWVGEACSPEPILQTLKRLRRKHTRDEAQRALELLARAICSQCSSTLDNGACLECGLCHCPFCGAEASTCCRHLLAAAADVGDGGDAPFSGGATAKLLIRSPF
jgi:hypothetical protein